MEERKRERKKEKGRKTSLIGSGFLKRTLTNTNGKKNNKVKPWILMYM